MNAEKINELIGRVFVRVFTEDDTALEFVGGDGYVVRFHHNQDCCEDVRIEDINGDLSDLEDAEILDAEVVTNENDAFGYDLYESFTWTFYKFRSIKGTVVVRWLGQSNGYYSESVDMAVVDPEKDRQDGLNNMNDFIDSSFSF